VTTESFAAAVGTTMLRAAVLPFALGAPLTTGATAMDSDLFYLRIRRANKDESHRESELEVPKEEIMFLSIYPEKVAFLFFWRCFFPACKSWKSLKYWAFINNSEVKSK
jgi:hypothetical protein